VSLPPAVPSCPVSEILDFVMGTGLIPADGEIWRKRRRAIVPALHKRYVASMVSCGGLRGELCSGQHLLVVLLLAAGGAVPDSALCCVVFEAGCEGVVCDADCEGVEAGYEAVVRGACKDACLQLSHPHHHHHQVCLMLFINVTLHLVLGI